MALLNIRVMLIVDMNTAGSRFEVPSGKSPPGVETVSTETFSGRCGEAGGGTYGKGIGLVFCCSNSKHTHHIAVSSFNAACSSQSHCNYLHLGGYAYIGIS